MAKEYLKIEAGIDMGTEYLINEVAYFLGSIIAADETVMIGDSKYMIAPVRHNKTKVTNEELEEHFYYIKALAKSISHETLMADTLERNGIKAKKFNGRMKGFATFFKVDDEVNLLDIVLKLEEALETSALEVKQSFIVGLFDGRGALDINKSKQTIRYFALDFNNSDVADVVIRILNKYGLETNYNRSRDRLEGGRPRANQLRIKNSELFMNKVGYISIRKFNDAKACFSDYEYKVCEKNEILTGLKTIKRKTLFSMMED